MEAWLNNLLDWIPIGWGYYTLLGLLAFAESLAFIGILCPGSVIIVFTGFLAASGRGDFAVLAAVYAAGSIAGDLASYLLGARAGTAIMQRPWFRKREALLDKARAFFDAHGGKSVFIGRFVGFLRPFIPFIAGSARMRPLPFIVYAVVSGILWGISYPGIGYLFGASWQMVKIWSGRFSLIILVLAGLFLLNTLFWRNAMPLIVRGARACGRGVRDLWQKFLASAPLQAFAAAHPQLWAFLARRFSTGHATGIILTAGIVVSLLFTLLFFGFGTAPQPSGPLLSLDRRVYDLVAVLHHPWTDAFFATLTWLASGQVLIVLGAFVLLVLVVNDRDFSALIFAGGLVGGELFCALIKQSFNRPRPIPVFPGLETIGASFPSGHAFTALLFYGLVVYFLLGTTRNWQTRILLVLSGSFLVLLIGLSRILLGVHWTSDVLGGYALAALWLTCLITVCEIRFRHGGFGLPRGWRPLNLSTRTRFAILAPAALAATGLIVSIVTPRMAAVSLERAPRPITRLSVPARAETLPADLPLATETIFGRPQRPLSLIVVSDRAALLRELTEAGWNRTDDTGFNGFRHLLADLLRDRPISRGTITPHLVEGRIQDDNFLRSEVTPDGTVLHTLLVWDLGRHFADGRNAWGLLATRQIGVQHLLGLPLPLPLADPGVDRERDTLLAAIPGDHRAAFVSLIAPAPDAKTGALLDSDGRVPVVILPLLEVNPATKE